MELSNPAYAGQQAGHNSRVRKASNVAPDRALREFSQERSSRLLSDDLVADEVLPMKA